MSRPYARRFVRAQESKEQRVKARGNRGRRCSRCFDGNRDQREHTQHEQRNSSLDTESKGDRDGSAGEVNRLSCELTPE